jgi:hypothetical protein
LQNPNQLGQVITADDAVNRFNLSGLHLFARVCQMKLESEGFP